MLDTLFIYDTTKIVAEKGEYNGSLVILSYIVASFSCYTALALARSLTFTEDKRQKSIIHWCGSFALGAGIWSMHFIGMLAYKMRMHIEYDIGLTIASLFIAVAAGYIVLAIVSRVQMNFGVVIATSLLLGLGISSMHYVGMAAMKMDAELKYQPDLFLLSIAIAIAASASALVIVRAVVQYKSKRRRLLKSCASLIMGLAICGMHYTGVAAAVFIPYAQCRYDSNQNFDTMAMAIAIVTSIILGSSLAHFIYNKKRSLQSREEVYAFPVKLLAASMLLTLGVVLWLGGNSFYIHYFLTHDMARSQQIAETADELLYLDSVLSQLAYAPSSGDEDFEARYREALDKDFEHKINNLPNKELQDIARLMDSTRDSLTILNRKRALLIKQQKIAEAEAVMKDEGYAKLNQTHMDGRRQLSEKIREASHQNLLSLENNIYAVLVMVIAVLIAVVVAWYFVFRSIRLWREELEASRLREMQANRSKSDFLANMSHEIRTPMHAILGTTGLLLDTEQTPEQQNWTEIIKKAGENLLDIINDILDFSKIEAGKLKLDSTVFDLPSVIMEVTDMLAFKVQEKNIELLVQLAPDLPYNVVGDPTRLRQILLNLVGNAIKFTQKGYIVIRLEWRKVNDTKLLFLFAIQDTGIGIPAEKTGHIFEKFSQAEESTTRKFGGTGLGLTISKSLVEMMDGHIGVKSEVGKGSVFHFDIMLQAASTDVQHVSLIPDCKLDGLRVLIVDDIDVNQQIVYKYTQTWSMRCDVASSAKQALQMMVEATQAGDPYKFVMIDYYIGDINGVELAEWIRNAPVSLDASLFLITALNQVITSSNLLEKGFSAYFSKPYYPDQLKAALQLLWDARQHGKKLPLVTRHMINNLLCQQARKQKIDTDMFPGKPVLVVEDMKVNLMLIIKVLERHGCVVSVAENGREAVEKVANHSYDVIFMDCQMPVMDGFEATRLIREMEGKLRHTPIIALTADAMTGDREKCLSAGMDDYLNKPFKAERITEMLMKWEGQLIAKEA